MEESRGLRVGGRAGGVPGHFRVWLGPDADATLVASTESWEAVRALTPAHGVGGGTAAARAAARRWRRLTLATARRAELVLAADQFIITPAGRLEDAARAHAAGDEVRTVIAGYHWFTDWGRDTMISLEGLTLATGRHVEAGYILRTFAHYVRDGLIPNMFPDGQNEGLYHTADATLWYFQAMDRYVAATGDRATLRDAASHASATSSDHHVRGTRFGIGVDPSDGLLRQGAEGYQLTWMDAKVDGWVVTPRRGKAVEINALWYNALRLLEQWLRDEEGDEAARPIATLADRSARVVQRPLLVRGGRLPVRRGGRRGGATTPRAGPISCWRSRWSIRCSTSAAGRRSWTIVRDSAADAGRPAFAGAGPSGLQAHVSRRPARAGRGLPPGHRLGLADWSHGRRLAAGASRRSGRRARSARGVHGAPGRGVHRIDQRGLRCRGSVHAARMCGAGVERGRSAALLVEDELTHTMPPPHTRRWAA